MLPQEICKIEHSGTLFPAFLEPNNHFFRQGWSSLKSEKVMKFGTFGRGTGRGNGSNFMSCLSKKKRLYKQMNSKTNNPHPLKYWHQSIGHRIANDPDETFGLRPSATNENPDCFIFTIPGYFTNKFNDHGEN